MKLIKFILPIAIILIWGYVCYGLLMRYFLSTLSSTISTIIVTSIFVITMFILWRLRILKWI